jgi:hypothetical protein
MKPAPVGTRVRVISNNNNHNYVVGRVYRIQHDDHDGTFKAADPLGKVGNWLRWEECEPAGPSAWERIAADLPADLVAFLSCFDGIADIQLREDIVDAMLEGLPDLHERVVALAHTPAGESMIAANKPQTR